MGIYKRARHLAVVAACATGMVAGVGAIAAPGEALAAECSNLKASGSSLQAEQQTHWDSGVKFTCLGGGAKFSVAYTSTSSGKGLEEFSLQENPTTKKYEIRPKLGVEEKLDAFIGSDDPPLKAAALTEAKKNAETNAITVPVIDAPIAIIVHAPSSCTITGTSSHFAITKSALSTLWDGGYGSWGSFLTASSIGHSGACSSGITLYAREEGSGTSFAFKQYLCQIEGTVWGGGAGKCESGEGFVSDAPKWPDESAITKTATGSGNMVSKVESTVGSIGYVNFASAANPENFHEWASGESLFWASLENGTATPAEPGAQVGAGEFSAGCDKKYEGTLPTISGTDGPEWGAVHVASPSSVAYPLCTLTYDVAWENYKGGGLAGLYGAAAETEKTAEGAKSYFKFMTSATEGQNKPASGYAALPTEAKNAGEKTIQELAVEAAGKVG